MFYVLDFKDHTFISCDSAEKVEKQLDLLKTKGVDDDSIEIVIGNDGNRMSIKEFEDNWC